MEIANSVIYFIIVIGILVLVHEFGHFITARMSGIRTDIFSIGMGFRLIGWNKKYGFTFGKLSKEATNSLSSEDGTYYCDYRISLLPIGGYVKIAGMVDESFDTEFANSEPKSWEFRSKNTFQKALVISGGVLMNFLLAIFVFSGISFFNGEVVNKTTTIGYVRPGSLGEISGFEQNDKILSVDDEPTDNWQDFRERLTLKHFGDSKNVLVLRNNEKVTIEVPGKSILDTLKKADTFEDAFGLAMANTKLLTSSVFTTMPAGKIGIKGGDTIISVNGEPIDSRIEFVQIIGSNPDNPVEIKWNHNGNIKSGTVTPNEDGKIGVAIADIYTGNIETRNFGIFESVSIGFNQTYSACSMLINSIIHIFQGKVSVKQSLGGPIFIAKSASQNAEKGIGNFMTFTALLSISLAVINIFPFPALDGGHLVFILIEGVLRREVSVKVKMAFQQIGVFVLIALMVFIFYIDLTR